MYVVQAYVTKTLLTIFTGVNFLCLNFLLEDHHVWKTC